MGREQLSVIQVITVYVHSRMEKDITVIFRRPIILEQDILSGRISCVYADLRELFSEMELLRAA